MRLYKFITSEKKKLHEFFVGSQNGLPSSLFKGYFLCVIQKNDIIEMHVVKSKNTKTYKSAIAVGVYPIENKSEITYNHLPF
jgi:hypothetical protein